MRHDRKRRRGERSPYAHEVYPDDVADVGRFFSKSSSHKRSDHKTRQLCRQVVRTLSSALPGCGDELLRDLAVASVEPAPDASRLLVAVYPMTRRDVPPAEFLRRLHQAQGLLRHEVAADIVRKRAPELAFHVHVPPAGGEEVWP